MPPSDGLVFLFLKVFIPFVLILNSIRGLLFLKLINKLKCFRGYSKYLVSDSSKFQYKFIFKIIPGRTILDCRSLLIEGAAI